MLVLVSLTASASYTCPLGYLFMVAPGLYYHLYHFTLIWITSGSLVVITWITFDIIKSRNFFGYFRRMHKCFLGYFRGKRPEFLYEFGLQWFDAWTRKLGGIFV